MKEVNRASYCKLQNMNMMLRNVKLIHMKSYLQVILCLITNYMKIVLE